MHSIEPFYNWRNLYIASEDEHSPFYNRIYSEFEFTDQIYDHLIHPQWDNIESSTLFIKIIFVDYYDGCAIIELFGEWNDCLYNDIMTLKRNIIDELIDKGITQFILICENILNFHYSDDCYYEEWFDDIEDGWIVLLNTREHVISDFEQGGIDNYFILGGEINNVNWRTNTPHFLYQKTAQLVAKRLGT